MPLEEYRRKRDFSKTPEPAPEVAKKKGRELFFCVQKHLASHLHYDFRLEPLAYGEFEGVIPEGYGAGLVMLWDRGTWTPEADDVDAALKKGDLKFKLDGYKMKGSWVLVRTGGRYGAGRSAGGESNGARSWLLIKHRDDWAGDLDITEFAPLSVKSGGDFEDILAADTPAIWKTNRPAKGGETGAMLAEIIERAAKLKSKKAETTQGSPRTRKASLAPATTRGRKVAR